MKKFPDLPPIWTLGAMVLSWIFARLVPLVSIDSKGLQWLGLLWIALAVLLIVWCALWFRRKKTTIEPHHKASALIVEGPYKVSRNPIYVALVIVALGFALWLGAASAFVPVFGLALALHRRFVLPEEAGLREVFGEEADAYISKTKRWV